VINALREFRTSETAMRRGTRSSPSMGETDLLALRYLVDAEAAESLSPQEIKAVMHFLTRRREAVDTANLAPHVGSM
jgi:hypothetical protein